MPMNKFYYFSSPRCSVCHVLLPKLEKIVKEQYPLLEWVAVNIDEDPKTAAEHSVFTVPVASVFFEGKEYIRLAQVFGIHEVTDKLDRIYPMWKETMVNS